MSRVGTTYRGSDDGVALMQTRRMTRGGGQPTSRGTGTPPGAGESLTALLAHDEPARAALVVPDTGQALTYAHLASRVETLAQRLASLGVRRGDRVALALPNGPDIVLLLLAITALGAAAAPLNPAYTETEFAFFLTDIAPRLLLVPATGSAAASAAARAAGTTLLAVQAAADGPPDLLTSDGAAAGLQRSFEQGGPDDVAFVLHTSGTTSRPKQVPLRQRNLMASARTIAAHYRAQRIRRLVLRDAAVSHPRPGGVDLRRAGSERRGDHAAPVHPAALLAAGSRARRPRGCRPVPRCIR